jgi:glycosyltransferase involved in cell wall biosynthesis
VNPLNPVKVSVVIPVHNEAAVLQQNIENMLQALRARAYKDWEILIVENGSSDETPHIAQRLSEREPGVQYMALKDASYGMAMQQGLLRCTGDVLVNFDIDYWDVDFLEIARQVIQVKYDIVIASKNLLLSKDKRSWVRRVASYAFRLILFFAFGLRVSDTHGIKAWRNSPRMRDHFRLSVPSHHTYDTEVIIRAMRNGCTVLEVPIEVLETRASDRRLIKRVPQAIREIVQLYWRLRRQ